MREPSAIASPDASARGTRLDSWKEIAAYLKRDIRTAQRWEKLEGLPVNRHRHDERGTAYAYSGEIDRWLEARTLRVTAAGGAHAPVSSPAAGRGRGRPQRSAAFVAAIAVMVLGSAGLARWWKASPQSNLTTLSVVFPASERFPDWGPTVVLSPDAQTIAYQGRGPIRLRRLDQLEGRTLLDGLGSLPFYSADGSSIGFFAPGRLMKVASGGGAQEEIASVDVDFVGTADWGSNGQIVFGTPALDGSHLLLRVAASGGAPAVIATLDGRKEPAYWVTPQWVDGGRHVVATVVRSSASSTEFQVVLVSVATGQARLLLDDARHARLIDDVLVYWRDNALFAVRFDLERLEPVGRHVTAWENVGSRTRVRSWATAADTLVYWPKVRSSRRLVWVGRDDREETVDLPAGDYQSPRLSRDSRRLAIIKTNGSSEFGDVWQHDLASGANLRLTNHNRTGAIIWAPDGDHVVASMREGGATALYRVRADGMGEPERLGPADFLKGAQLQPVGWTGGRLVVHQGTIRQAATYWALSLDGSTAPRAILNDRTTGPGAVSPDGQWLAYASMVADRGQVHVAKLPEGSPTSQISVDGGRNPRWSTNGRELFYRNGNRVMAVDVTVSGNRLIAGRPRPVLERDVYEVDPGEPHYDVAVDGRFLMMLRGGVDGPERLNVIQGWRSEVERRLSAAR